MMNTDIRPTIFKVSQENRLQLLCQNPKLIWFTGFSGSGKSTLANGTELALFQKGFHTYLLDGDNIRTGLNKDLAFTDEDRVENIRRIAEVCKLMMDAGLIVVSAFISPFVEDRQMIKDLIGEDRFFEIFVDCPLEICESRDVKGLYKKARRGLIKNFTGIDSPYEAPTDPFLTIKTAEEDINRSIDKIISSLQVNVKAAIF